MRHRSGLPPLVDPFKRFERAAQTRLLYAHERVLIPRVAAVLAQNGRRVARALETRNASAVAAAQEPLRDELGATLAPAMIDVARAFGTRLASAPKSAWAFKGIEAKRLFGTIDDRIRELLEEWTASRIVAIDDWLRERIADEIRQGLEDGKSETEIANRIREISEGQIGQARARTIARTETHTASQVGQEAAAQASPFEWTKEWLATEDPRTRPDHAEANGQTVPQADKFRVGDSLLQHPGDPNGPPGQIINCRCTALFEPVLE